MADKKQESLTSQLQQTKSQLSATEINLARAESDLQRTTESLRDAEGERSTSGICRHSVHGSLYYNHKLYISLSKAFSFSVLCY